MATPLVTKIVLKNTTKMSLNERFTAYRAEAQTSANSYRQKLQMQRQATSANLRLAQQMANRPTVIAALRLKKRSMQQRLGGAHNKPQGSTNVKSRLNLGGKRLNGNSNSLQGRLGTIRGRGPSRGRGAFRPGTSPLVKARLGLPRQTGGSNFGSPQYQRVRGNDNKQRGGFRGRNRGRGSRGGNRNRPQPQQRGAGNRGGRNRGGGRWNPKTGLTRQELDNQLDQYMAETKTSLDAQLGQYMQQG